MIIILYLLFLLIFSKGCYGTSLDPSCGGGLLQSQRANCDYEQNLLKLSSNNLRAYLEPEKDLIDHKKKREIIPNLKCMVFSFIQSHFAGNTR